jgi:hypothetical protein
MNGNPEDRSDHETNSDDGMSQQSKGWGWGERRRYRKEAVQAATAYLLLFCCAAVAAALSFHGLVGFGRQNLRLSGGWEYLVPFGLDGAAMFSAMIAVREASHGDASLGSRMLVWAFAGASAWFNWVHAPRGGGHDGAPQFFAGMSLSAAVLFDRALKQTRRAALREQGLVPRPLPQIRVVRWLRAPRETYRAWSLMLLEGVQTLDEAVDEARDERRNEERDRLRRREQRRLERARVRALNRQHRLWRRGGAAGGASAAPAVPAAPAPAKQLLPRSRAALRAGTQDANGGGETTVESAGSPQTASIEPRVDSGPGRSEADDGDRDGDGNNATSPRLDSLEEKLAEIERQFG